MNSGKWGTCRPTIDVKDHRVLLANDNDPYYTSEFDSRNELEEFIVALRVAATEAWPTDVSPGQKHGVSDDRVD